MAGNGKLMKSSTKDRILEVSERLFATQGLEVTSLRQITREADVNLAAVNYHFGSKDGLIQAAFERRVGPINTERLRLLDEYEGQVSATEPLELERVLDAFVRPVFSLTCNGKPQDMLFLRLIGRTYSDPCEQMRQVFLRHFAEVLIRYRIAFRRALPRLREPEVTWRIHFLVGILAHALLTGHNLREYTQGVCEVTDVEQVMKRIIDFAAAGMRQGLS